MNHEVDALSNVDMGNRRGRFDRVVVIGKLKFNLVGCPEAQSCYPWSYVDRYDVRSVKILDAYPVVSAEMAVRLALPSGDFC